MEAMFLEQAAGSEIAPHDRRGKFRQPEVVSSKVYQCVEGFGAIPLSLEVGPQPHRHFAGSTVQRHFADDELVGFFDDAQVECPASNCCVK